MDSVYINIKKAVDYVGNQTELAKQLGVTRQAISNWVRLKSPVGVKHAVKIQEVTNGEVKFYDLRPDIFQKKAHKR